jgi:hypothetical protein
MCEALWSGRAAFWPRRALHRDRNRRKVRREGKYGMRIGILSLIAASGAVILAAGDAGAQSVGAVAAARGEAALERNNGRETAAAGADVMLDDRATTGEESRLDLKLGAATRLRLGANAALKIDKFVAKLSAESTLEQGAVLIDRAKGAEKSFDLKTPYGLLSARGTVFFVGPSRGTFGVFVQKGAVDVVTRRGSVRVRAGEGVDFQLRSVIGLPPSLSGDAEEPVPSPVKKWGAERIREALDSVR